ncbi:DUF4012 domain-containing protein, partial [Patescibacteria group bacterium]|nr:DUF4012 domain-containing protein [Patescibacteria group bacterium]
DLVLLEKAFVQTEQDIEGLRQDRDAKFGWAKNMPRVKEFYADSDYFLNSALYAIDAGREFSRIITPFADAAGLKIEEGQEVATKSFADAFADWIALMPKVANDIDPLLVKIDKVGDELAKVDAGKYPESFRGTVIKSNIVYAQNTLSSLSDYGPDLKQALILVPKILGVDAPEKRYMIIMQNNAEMRPTGGFWTNYATFKIRNAMLNSDFTSKDMYSIDFTLDAIDAYTDFSIGMPAPLRRYLLLERWYARDANFSPDFPTSVNDFMRSYRKAIQINPVEVKPVDGIFAIDTRVVSELLEVTGPATVNGITYNQDNVVLELEKIASLALREQSNRKKVLGDLMERMLVNVFESDKNLWPKLVDKGVDLLNRKHILIFMFDPDAQALLEKYNFAGRLVDTPQSDYLAVISSNLAGDKTNLFVRRQITSSIVNENGKWAREVKVNYTYGPAEGEYALFATTYKDYLRLYVPKGSTLVSVTGSEDGDGSGDELNKTYFHGYITLAPGATKEISFKYYLPDGVIKDNTYRLYIQKQAGMPEETYQLSVNGKQSTVKTDKDYKFSVKL